MRTRPTILFLLLVVMLMAPGAVSTAAAQAAPAENVCVALVADESGSMADNDPTFLRNTGAKLFVSVLDAGDRVGVVRFSSSARRLTPDLVTLNGPEDKRALLALLDDAPPEGYTDLKAALAEARGLLEGAACGSRFIVLLSDGYPQLESGLPAGYSAETVALVRELNVPIFGIALTAEGESSLLYRLAAATDPPGRVIPARAASDLLDAYLDVVAQLKDRTVVGRGFTAAPGRASLPLEPGLAQYVSRVTYIVSKPGGVTADLVEPGGETVSAGASDVVFVYDDDPRFAALTVENPAPGDWTWLLDGNGQVQARAILRSRLRVVAEQPAAYHALGRPMPIGARLVEEEADGTLTTLIGQATFSAFITRPDGSQDELDRLYDDGGSTAGVASGDTRANDGLFTNTYVKTELPGEYTIVLTGYKGAIPATRTVRVLVVPFPEIEVLASSLPSGGPLEFRGEPLPLSMRLAGGDPPTIDTGTFVAEVAGPDGGAAEVSLLQQDDGSWTGSFAPTADGFHTITFRPRDATYKGVPYTLTAGRAVEVRLVPTIDLTLAQDDLASVEVAELAQGVTLAVDATSSSPQPEPVQFELAGFRDLEVAGVSPEIVPPGESTVYVTVQGRATPGESEGALVATAPSGVDLVEHELPFAMDIYQPALLAEPEALVIEVRRDRLDREERFLTVSSQSRKDETVQMAWYGSDAVELVAEPIVVPAGKTVEIPVRFAGGLDEGSYAGEIRLSSREGVSLQPAVVPTTVEIVPVPWCARWCLPLAGVGLAALVAVVAVRNHLRRRPRPHGVLQPVKAPPGQSLPGALPVVSSGSQAVIGSGRRADVHLTGGGVQAKHAAIRAREETVVERVGRPPQLVEVEKAVNVVRNLGDGVVKVNGVAIAPEQESASLQPGARITIGDYEFVYRL